MKRRDFMSLLAGTSLWGFSDAASPAEPTRHRVGVGRGSDPYATTIRAVEACGQWPAHRIAGATVVIKPNLVTPPRSDNPATATDLGVVQALVDLSLASGAASVIVAESLFFPYTFEMYGYDRFQTYPDQARVSLLELALRPNVFRTVPGALTYHQMYLPDIVASPSVVFISAAKLKCHTNTGVTLCLKNLVGCLPMSAYGQWPIQIRVPMHQRGLDQAIVDLSLARPIDFAVIDGVWAMEGEGPSLGNPVHLGLVLAGANAVAVDRVGVLAMGFPNDFAHHLELASAKGLGPADVREVELAGDPIPDRPFLPPNVPPLAHAPVCDPRVMILPGVTSMNISVQVDQPCRVKVEVLRTWDLFPGWFFPVRMLRDAALCPAGILRLAWDARDNDGRQVRLGIYCVRVTTDTGSGTNDSFALTKTLVFPRL